MDEANLQPSRDLEARLMNSSSPTGKIISDTHAFLEKLDLNAAADPPAHIVIRGIEVKLGAPATVMSEAVLAMGEWAVEVGVAEGMEKQKSTSLNVLGSAQ